MTDLAVVQDRVGGLLNEIALNFKAGVKLTLIVRSPGFPDRDFLMTSDTLPEARAVIDRREASPDD